MNFLNNNIVQKKDDSSAYALAHGLMEKEMQYNSLEAQKNRDFQERMSNTAYTRAVSDLRNAGLNPYLVVSNGGASTVSGSSASYSGYAQSVYSGITSQLNTYANNQTARDVAMINATAKVISSFIPKSIKK